MQPVVEPVSTVDAYLKTQPPATRRLLRLVRKAIRAALPGAHEAISYRIPAYKLNGQAVIYFAGWARHYSIYPVTSAVMETCGEQLAAYQVEKGTIRFPLDLPVPVELIARIASVRGEEAALGRGRRAAPIRKS